MKVKREEIRGEKNTGQKKWSKEWKRKRKYEERKKKDIREIKREDCRQGRGRGGGEE